MTALLALVLAVLGPCPDARPIADAVAHAVEARAAQGLAPVTASPAEDAALLAVYARLESGGRVHPQPWSWDARAGVSCGPWQMPCGIRASLRGQAATWLRWVAEGGLAGVDSSARRARVRSAEARRWVRGAI